MKNINIIIVIASASLIFIGGCGGSADDETSQIAQPQVDPRFASADALLEHVNRLQTANPQDPQAFMELLHAENPFQQRIVTLMHTMIPMAIMDQAIFERFGHGIDPKNKQSMLAPEGPATIIEREAQRARAQYTGNRGKKNDLYLIKIGERWWISGFTMEYDSDFSEIRGSLDGSERVMAAMAAVAPSLTQRLRAGEFKKYPDFQRALAEALLTNTRQ